MEKKISELFDYGDGIVVIDEINKMFDPKEIKEKTMQKIHTDNASKSTGKASRISRRVICVAAAACFVIAMAVVAYAANLWGIRELWQSQGRGELPEGVSEVIEPRQETAASEYLSVRVTESVCDKYTVLVAATISVTDEYILSCNATPEDPVSVIGREGNETLAEYAAANGKTLLYVGWTLYPELDAEALGSISGNVRSQNISDNEMVVMKYIGKDVSTPSLDAVFTVWTGEYYSGEQKARVEIPLTLTETTYETLEFVPVDGNAIPGLNVGTATVTRTPLGVNIEFPVDADAELIANRGIVSIGCDDISDWQGTFRWEEDNTGRALWTVGDGTVGDTLTIHFYDGDDEFVGDIVFKNNG